MGPQSWTRICGNVARDYCCLKNIIMHNSARNWWTFYEAIFWNYIMSMTVVYAYQKSNSLTNTSLQILMSSFSTFSLYSLANFCFLEPVSVFCSIDEITWRWRGLNVKLTENESFVIYVVSFKQWNYDSGDYKLILNEYHN